MSFQKGIQFISRNRQQLMNILGMGIIFSYSAHNYRLKIEWDEHEVEMAGIKAENVRIKATLGDNSWMKSAGERIRRGKSTLEQEIQERLAEPVEPTAMDKVKAQQAELALIQKELGVGISTGNDGGANGGGKII
jgi:hypothetical protein